MTIPRIPTSQDDTFDSREVIEAIDWLTDDERDYDEEPDERDYDEEPDEELQALLELQEAAGDAPDWRYGVTFIRDSYFEDYAQQFAEDVGAIDREAAWPCYHIDWEAAAASLQQDYTMVEFDGVTYWYR